MKHIQALTYEILRENLKLSLLYFFAILITFPVENILSPQIFSNFIEASANSKATDVYIQFIAYSFLLYMFLFLSSILTNYCYNHLIPSIHSYCNDFIFEKLLNRLEHEFSSVDVGKLISRVVVIPDKIQDFLTSVFLFFFPRALTVLIISIYFFFLDWKVAIVFFVLLLIFLLSLIYSGVMTCSHLASDFHISSENHFGFMEDKLTNASSILAFGQKERETELAKQESKQVGNLQTEVLNCSSWGRNVTNLFLAIVFTSVCSLSIYLFFAGEISHGIMITIILTMSFMIPNLEAFSTLSDIGYYLGRFREIDVFLSELDVVTEKLEKVSEKLPKQSQHFFPAIEIHDLTFSYNPSSPVILNNLNLTVLKHELVVIKGKSGSGKTTFLKLLTGFLKPQRGSIQILGKNIHEYSIPQLRATIGMVSQNTRLFNSTVLQNIIYGSEWMLRDEKESHSFVTNLLKILEISDLFDKMPHGLLSPVGLEGEDVSGGQRQVILIMRLLINSMDSTSQMKIAILDEPTSAVDFVHTKVIIHLMKKLAKKLTTFVITHDPYVSSNLHAREISFDG